MSKDVRGSLTGIDKASMAEVRRQMEKVRQTSNFKGELTHRVPKIDRTKYGVILRML
jgi:hypothetical protein